MQVAFIYQHIDHRFVGVVEIASMSPAFTTVYLNEDLCESFECLASRDEDRYLGEPCHIAPRLVKLATPTRGAKELVSRGWYWHLEPYGLAFIFCNKTSASFLTSRL